MTEHIPRPYQEFIGEKMDGPAGVKCTCGADFRIGQSYPDTRGGKESKRTIKKMKHAWELYREHWAKELERGRASS